MSAETIETLLTADEAEFVRNVFCAPGRKYPGGSDFWDRIDMDCGIWIKPESLGIVRPVGSYKWEPTEKLKLCRASETCERCNGTGRMLIAVADTRIKCDQCRG